MKKIVTIEFDELVKSITTKTRIVYEFETLEEVLPNDVILKEQIALFERASAYTLIAGGKKSGNGKG